MSREQFYIRAKSMTGEADWWLVQTFARGTRTKLETYWDDHRFEYFDSLTAAKRRLRSHCVRHLGVGRFVEIVKYVLVDGHPVCEVVYSRAPALHQLAEQAE